MSYEGYTVYICTKGHYFQESYWSDGYDCCPICSSPKKYIQNVDETTEFDPPELLVIGYEDIWQTDHYGNKYATKRNLYKPGSGWEKFE